jgi:hypothetical protein
MLCSNPKTRMILQLLEQEMRGERARMILGMPVLLP